MRKVLLDQGLPRSAVPLLQEQDWDAVHVGEIGLHEATDEEILRHAASDLRVVVTLDRDFPQILAMLSSQGPSVILVRQERFRAPHLVDLLNSVWQAHQQDLERGCVVTVGFRGARVRRLPLR